MLENLNNTELYAYLKMCEMNLGFLDTKRRLNPSDLEISKNYNHSLKLRNKLYNEVNNRLKAITKLYELDKEDL